MPATGKRGRAEEHESGEPRQGAVVREESKVIITIPGMLIEDLARELGIPTTITESTGALASIGWCLT
jgi:hypothetical protein